LSEDIITKSKGRHAMKQYILFDLDGTLTESAPGIINSLKYALERLGVQDYDRAILDKFIGPPLAVSFEKFFGFKGEKCNNAVKIYREYFSEKGLFENAVYSGVEDMLDTLKSAGLKLAVATSKPEVYARRILDKFGLSKYFEVICGIPLNNEHMTKAQVIARAINELGAANKQAALMVGDRDYDVAGAHQNGIECLGVTYGYGSREELEGAGAEYIAVSAENAAELIIKLR